LKTARLLPVMAGLKEVIERKGCFAPLYSDRGSHFWLTPKAGGKIDEQRLTQADRALREVGVQMIPAYSLQARGKFGAQLWDLARTFAAGAEAAGHAQRGSGQSFSARALYS
jgi:hypothetical protein